MLWNQALRSPLGASPPSLSHAQFRQSTLPTGVCCSHVAVFPWEGKVQSPLLLIVFFLVQEVYSREKENHVKEKGRSLLQSQFDS